MDLDLPADLQPFFLPDVQPTSRELGRGAYGYVKEVEIPGAVCAAKMIHEDLLQFCTNEDFQHLTTTFVNECKLMSTLRHPHIVQFLGVCCLPGSRLPSLIMECLETSLHELLESTKRLPLAMKQSFLLDIARGLLYLHSQLPPIIHRDLTARNVLLNSGLVAKIGDMGVARIIDLKPNQLAATMTRGPGNIVYMPPEAMGEITKYNTSLDVFSFGNIALFALTQEFPGQKLKAATKTDPQTGRVSGLSEIERREYAFDFLSSMLGSDDHPLIYLAGNCLQNLPVNRPSAEELVQQLDEISANASSPTYRTLNKLELMQRMLIKEDEKREVLQQLYERDEENATLKHENAFQDECLQKKDDEIRILQEQLALQEDRIHSIERRLDALQIQDTVTKEEIETLWSELDKMKEKDELYFPSSFRWTSKNNIPRDISPGVAVVLDNLVYCRSLDAVYQYNPVTDTWTVLPEVPMSNFITTVLDGQLIVVGGTEKGSKIPVPVDTIMAWDNTSMQWIQPYPPLPTGLFRFGCNGYKHYLIISGGITSTYTSAVYILDTHAQQWYEAPPLPFEGNTARTVIIGETLYITLLYHGMITSSKSITSVSLPALIASAISDKNHDLTIWKALPDLPFYISTLLSVGKMLATIGGRLEGSLSIVFERMKLKSSKICADIHIFNHHINQWVKVGELPEMVYDCTCTMLPSGKLLVAGGKTDTDERSHSVYVASILTRSSLENTACTS